MKAQMLYGIGNIRYTEVENPVPGDDEALVRVLRCGICGSDVPRVFSTGAHNMPLIPGHEMMGVVQSCDKRPELVGKRVGIFPLIPCKKCPNCLQGHYEMCVSYNYLGSRCDGGFAEYVKVPVWNLLPVPDEVSDDEAAMLEPMGVAVHAIRRTAVFDNPDANVVVCGLGTIGLLTALFLKDAGCRNVFCIGNKDIQRDKLLQMGYAPGNFCDARNTDPKEFVSEKTGGRGADYYFECIGRPESYAQAVECAAPLGGIVLVGNPHGDMNLPKEIYWKILRNQMKLTGTWNSSFAGIDAESSDNKKSRREICDDWRYVIGRLTAIHSGSSASGAFSPADLITHRFTLDDLDKGLDIMRNKTQEYIKVMIAV
jgi:L-iditol 2-dehydrogenase